MKKNNGITLISLVVTIIILLVLAGVTIAMLTGQNGVLTKAEMAKLATELSKYKEEVEIYKAGKKAENIEFLPESLTVGKNNLFYNTQPQEETGNITTIIKDIDSKYIDVLEIIKGELLLSTQDKDLIKLAQSLGIKVNPYDIIDGVLLSSNGNLLLMDENGTVTIPDSVTKIGEGAFANLDGLKTIIIPGSVKEIASNAFAYNATLEKVVMQEGIERIGVCAFNGCSRLKQVFFPESLINIENQSFYLCISLNKIEIPSNITEIKSSVFAGCRNLKEVVFKGNKIAKLGKGAFSDCLFSDFTIPSSVSSIDVETFSSCSNLENITIDSENKNFVYESGMLMSSNRENIIFISQKYFSSITEFTIPNGIKSLSTDIRSLTNIKKLIIPASIEEIAPRSLPYTLQEVVIDSNNQKYKTFENCIYTKNNENLVFCYSKEKEIILKNEAKYIDSYSFRGAINIEKIELAETIRTIGQQVFSNCSKLQELKIGKNVDYIDPIFKYMNYSGQVIIDSENPNYMIENNIIYSKNKEKLIAIVYQIQGNFVLNSTVKEIGSRAFHNQGGMTSIELTNNLEIIRNPFNYCVGLTSIDIPNSVTIIEGAFFSSSNLKEIRIHKPKDSIAGAPWECPLGNRAVIWDN